jgi:hypothetical protein
LLNPLLALVPKPAQRKSLLVVGLLVAVFDPALVERVAFEVAVCLLEIV